jgi:general secretion pathway protein D
MTDTRLLNRPSALVLDGGTAVVNLGGQLRYLSRVNVTVTGTAGTTVRAPVTETLDTGQNLRITPRIMPNDIILLSMTFDDTALQNFQTFGQGDTAVTLPQTTRRAMSMPMFVKNGAAVIIGGLKNQRKDRSSAKIPLLSEVPFLGRNFGRNQKRNQSNELVVVVKATAIAAEDF